MESTPYHLRRMDRDMPERADQIAVLRGQKFLTLAMADGDQPYLVTLNHAYSEAEHCLYVHCATEGKKLAFLRRNGRVWGQVIEDRGYIVGECSHAYRSVMFEACAEFIDDVEAKRRALAMMIDCIEPEPDPLKRKLIENQRLANVVVVRLRIESMTGKQNPGGQKG